MFGIKNIVWKLQWDREEKALHTALLQKMYEM